MSVHIIIAINMRLSIFPYSGADITATDAESYTPLMLAAVAGHVEAFNALLNRGSAIHKNVLHLAAMENHTDVLQVSFAGIFWCQP